MIRKIIGWTVAISMVFYVAYQPEKAANQLTHVGAGIGSAFDGIATIIGGIGDAAGKKKSPS